MEECATPDVCAAWRPSVSERTRASRLWTSPACACCGKRHGKDAGCPAENQACRKCGRRGHFARCCQKKMEAAPSPASGVVLAASVVAPSPVLKVRVRKIDSSGRHKSSGVSDRSGASQRVEDICEKII